MKRTAFISLILLILISGGLIFNYSAPVSAYTPPGQGTDNATDVILWGDNVSVNVTITDNITITDLEVALTAAAEAHTEDIGEITDDVIGFVLVLAILTAAFSTDILFFYILAAPASVVYGFLLASENDVNSTLWVTGVIVAIVGLACLYEAVVMGFGLEKLRLRRRR